MKPTLLIIDEKRDYKAEYKKYGSSTKAKKYRAELNQYNRKKGTYGNGDGKDASHKGGKIVGFESQSKNRGRAEKSRLKSEVLSRGGAIELFGHAKYLGQGIKDMTKAYKKKDWAQMEEEVDYIVTKAKMMGDIVKQKRYQESVNEDVKTHTIQGSKRWMIKTALPILKNYGIKKVKVNNVGKTNFFYFKITFDTDSNTLKKLDGELKRKNKKSNNYIVKQKRYQESVNEAKIAHSKGGYVEVGKWYLLNYGKWKDTVKVVSIDSKGMKVYNPNDNWRYTIPMTMIKKKKIGGYMTPIDESVKVFESTKEYEKSLDKIANDKTLKMMSKKDRDTLKKIADLIKKSRGK